MGLSQADFLGSSGTINKSNGTVTLKISDFVDVNGIPYLEQDEYALADNVLTAQRFIAAYFAHLALKCPQQFKLTPQEIEDGVEVGSIPDSTQAIVAQENQITDGFSFEKRGDVTQIRYDFIFSVYLQNTFKYDPGLTVYAPQPYSPGQ